MAETTPSIDDTNPIATFFNTPELLHHSLQYLLDTQSLSDISSLSLVSKQFRQTLTSDILWRELCFRRWKSKWGFAERWEGALREYDEGKHGNHNESGEDSYWKNKYKSQEADAKRQRVSGAELAELTFDFRFWIGNPTVVDGRVVVQSGLYESRSSTLRFGIDDDSAENEWWSARGVITGHPLRTNDEIRWFLNEESGVIQWGFVPNLWPEGSVRRLDTWGWEIRNCNVIMRAIDREVANEYLVCDKLDLERAKQNENDQLWKDLLDDLDNIPLRNNPTVNGFLVTAELPRTYLDQFSL
jgi:Arc/MetJ-type ribon-helix-helix transcriptional regulator